MALISRARPLQDGMTGCFFSSPEQKKKSTQNLMREKGDDGHASDTFDGAEREDGNK